MFRWLLKIDFAEIPDDVLCESIGNDSLQLIFDQALSNLIV